MMNRILLYSISIVALLGMADCTLALPLKVDIGDIGQDVKSGWEEFSGDANDQSDPKTVVYHIDELEITVSLETGVLNDSNYRDYSQFGGGDLGADMLYPDEYSGPFNGCIFLTLSGLPARRYIVTSYHNDINPGHAQQAPIDVTVSGAISYPVSDLGVVQTKSLDDSNLGQSSVIFTANGTGNVFIIYAPTADNGDTSKAVLNGFELDAADTVVQFDSPTSSGIETESPAMLAVTLLYPVEGQAVTVDYAATGGTAVGGGTDYTLAPGTLILTAEAATQTIDINIMDDGPYEDDETIEVTLSNPNNVELGAITQHVFTILDPSPTVAFETAASEGPEHVSPAYVPVSLSWPWQDTVTVDYNVTGGTAINGEDYSLAAGTLSFDPCEVTQYISISIVDDDFLEDPDETIEITLSNPSNSKLRTIAQHTLTILPAAAQVCPEGDLDGDCEVDFNDLEIFVLQWLDPSGSCPNSNDCADFDRMNGVNMLDFALLAGNWCEEASPLVINEFMASNGGFLTDPCDPEETPDWFELYNASAFPVDLGGMYLTDELSEPTHYEIPAGVTIGAYGYLLFYADNSDYGEDPMRTNFALGADGEEIGLFDANGTLIDAIVFEDQATDISYGRYPDAGDNLRFFATPTPEAENEGAYLGEVADTKFSHDRGFYESAFNLSITCNTGGADIHYTLDGNEPSEFDVGSTYVYTSPISINQTTTVRAAAFKPGYLPTNVDTQTYIFLNDVLNQPYIDQGVVATYGASVVKDAFKSIPTLSVVMNASDLENLQLQDSRDGPGDPHPKEELPTSAELIYADPNDGEGLQINCGIEGHSWALDKRSYKLIFKSVFGPTQLRYPFFESAPVNADSAVDEFDRIVLRASKNMPITYAGDQWTRDCQIAMSDIGGHGNFVHLYLNGTYWGLYNATERPDAWFTSSYFGGQKEDYFATNHGIERGEDHISGDSSRFDTMISMAQVQNLEVPSNYETFKGLCDVTNFADYTILFWFSGFGDNIDNNWYAGMRNVPLTGAVPPEGLMMFMWDAEYVFKNEGGPPGHYEPWVPYYYFTMTGHTIVDTWLALYENVDFRMLFADRIYKHCFNGGALTDGNTQGRWNAIVDYITDAAICEKARWPWGGGYSGPATVPPEHVDMTGFVNIFMTALYNWGWLYPTIDPPTFNQHGGHVPYGFSLEMVNPNGYGTIYATANGSDPREPVTGNPVGIPYSGPVTLTKSVHVKARVWDGSEWSALNEATFAVGPVANRLRITEVMYHPQDTNDPNDPNTEFIELKNIGPGPINYNLVSFTDGVEFTFPPGALAPNAYVVVVKDQNAFEARYGTGINIAGEYTGRFNNAGERVELVDAVGQTIHDFRYEDSWRPITDGDGYSLALIDPTNSDPNSWSEKDSWRAS
ncbi:MAG: lamin tail domain-containing protein, partial [Planctomycetota bacterium]